MQEGSQYVKKIGGVFAFKVKDGPDGREATWIVNVRDGKGCVHNDTCEWILDSDWSEGVSIATAYLG